MGGSKESTGLYSKLPQGSVDIAAGGFPGRGLQNSYGWMAVELTEQWQGQEWSRGLSTRDQSECKNPEGNQECSRR